jgi:hypothetical protein
MLLDVFEGSSSFGGARVVDRFFSMFVGCVLTFSVLGVIHEVPFYLSRRTFSTVNGTARGMVL